jgi:hypothetical protein
LFVVDFLPMLSIAAPVVHSAKFIEYGKDEEKSVAYLVMGRLGDNLMRSRG